MAKEKTVPTAKVQRQLIHALSADNRYAKAFSECAQTGDCDFLGKMLLAISHETGPGNTFELIKDLIAWEIQKYRHQPSNIFRSNSLSSKALGTYVRDVGKNYLKLVLGDILDELMSDKSSLEIDPDKIKESNEKESQRKLEKHQRKLKEWCEKILDKIFDPEMVDKMPPQLRIVASHIAQISDSYQLDTPVLIGGFIILRFFNPAIAAPEIFNVVTPKKKSKNGQRNLILISKIIQNLANGVLFGNKEKFMIIMNDFLVSKREDMRNYLLSITDKEFASAVTGEEIRQIHEEDINLEKYDQQDIIKLHKLFLEYTKDIAPFFLIDGAKQVRTINDIMSDCLKVIALSRDLGLEPTDDFIVTEKMANAIFRVRDRVDNAAQESKFFFYRGKQSRERRPVFYLIASRITEELVTTNFGPFLYTIIKILGKVVESVEWCLIIDMTFVNVSASQRQLINSVVERIVPFLNPIIFKNLSQLFVVHPTNYKTNLYDVFKGVFKSIFPNVSHKESMKKIVEVNTWTQLHQYIRPTSVLLPEDSKAYIPDSFKVVKINPKGKHQDRIIKLTPKSILNIDPKNNTIKNERLLSEVEEVSAPQSNLEVHMKFRPTNKPTAPFFSSHGDIDQSDNYNHLDDSVFRRYIVNTEKERSELLEELFETTVQSQFIDTIQAFQLTETTFSTDDEAADKRETRKVERVYKFSNDSILVVDKRTIKAELPFIAMEYVKLSDQKDSVILKMKNEDNERILVCEARNKQVEDSILDGIKRAVERVRMRSLAEPDSDGEGEEEEELEDDEVRDSEPLTEEPDINNKSPEEPIPITEPQQNVIEEKQE